MSGKSSMPRPNAPYAIALRSGEPYAFAGLWESWKPKDAEPLETFTIITTDPNAVTEKLHDRMPVILEPADYNRWLDPRRSLAASH
jgi:putative SOS response-associated peptidase YedK